MKNPRASAALPLRCLLGIEGVRRRLAFAIRQDYMDELHLQMPLEPGFNAPLDHWDAFIAFSETFLSDEYGDLFRRIPLPDKWLDFGCHRGFFSLWVAWEKARHMHKAPGNALLLDADPRAQKWFANLLAANASLQTFQFLHGAVAKAEAGDEVTFAQRAGMNSVHPGDMPVEIGDTIRVPRLKADAIRSLLPPPYDLIKVDIEGAEFALLETLGDIISQATCLVVEWHGWNDGGVSAQARLRKAAADLGFGPPEDLRDNRSSPPADVTFVTGTHLYRRRS